MYIGIYGDLITIYPKPYSIYLRGTMSPGLRACLLEGRVWGGAWVLKPLPGVPGFYAAHSEGLYSGQALLESLRLRTSKGSYIRLLEGGAVSTLEAPSFDEIRRGTVKFRR